VNTINGLSVEGNILILRASSSSNALTVSNGTFLLAGGADFVSTSLNDMLVLFNVGGTWVEIARSDNG
jgi:hypothetical protein